MNRCATATVAVLCLMPKLAAQSITLAEGLPGQLQIVNLPESNPNGPGTTVLDNG